jgi:hypothetical protein
MSCDIHQTVGHRRRPNQFILWACVLFFLTGGCSTMSSYRRVYEGPSKSLKEVAILGFSYNSEPIYIDGKEMHETVVEFTPGSHSICAAFWDIEDRSSTDCASITYQFLAGHVYELRVILHTHSDTWVPGIWDVTAELKYSDKQWFLEKIVSVLEKNRGTPLDAPWMPTEIIKDKLPGHGEIKKADYVDRHGRTVTLEYRYYKYKPFIVADGSDGNRYHLEISQSNGQLIKVLGKQVVLGDFFKGKTSIYQPTGSEFAYQMKSFVSYSVQTEDAIYKEVEPYTFKLIKDTYIAVYDDNAYTFLIDPADVEGMPKSAVDAVVLMHNAIPPTLYQKLSSEKIDPRSPSQSDSPISQLYCAYEMAASLSREASRLAAIAVSECAPGTAQFDKAKDIENETRAHANQCRVIWERANTIPNIQSLSTGVRFFEGPQEILPYEQRRYSNQFSQRTTRFIAWELGIQIQPPGRSMEYMVFALWKDANDKIVAIQTRDVQVEPDWTNIWNAHSYGWEVPGSWPPGSYRVELYIGQKQISTGQFNID